MPNVRFFVSALAAHAVSFRRVRQLKASVMALPCQSSIRLTVLRLSRSKKTVENKIAVFQAAQKYQRRHPGLVGFLEDDVVLSPTFCSDFQMTVDQLPPAWGVFHMCPGFVWGRSFPDHEHRKIEYRPEMPFSSVTAPLRFFWGVPAPEAWLGGPEALVMSDWRIWGDLIAHMAQGMGLTDVDMTLNALQHPGRDFVARDPPLCKESDDGVSIRLG